MTAAIVLAAGAGGAARFAGVGALAVGALTIGAAAFVRRTGGAGRTCGGDRTECQPGQQAEQRKHLTHGKSPDKNTNHWVQSRDNANENKRNGGSAKSNDRKSCLEFRQEERAQHWAVGREKKSRPERKRQNRVGKEWEVVALHLKYFVWLATHGCGSLVHPTKVL